MSDKLQVLARTIKKYEKIAIAFSGGVDSSFLSAMAKKHCPSVLAITVTSEFQSQKEADNAVSMARALSLCHLTVHARVLDDPKIVENTRDRCYFCKKALFSLLKTTALAHGFHTIAHGANLDDLNDYRPGFRAAREMGVIAPLIEAELTKAEIRTFSRDLGLGTWDMPSQSCLATRIPYGDKLSKDKLAMVENGENVLFDLGFRSGRIRCHGEVARIELAPKDLDLLLEEKMRRALVGKIKQAGFKYVSADLEGYVRGSMNRSFHNSEIVKDI